MPVIVSPSACPRNVSGCLVLAEDDMVAVHAAFESTGLIGPFAVAGDRVAILLEVDSFCIEDPVPVFASARRQ